jgi:hypothetical protein
LDDCRYAAGLPKFTVLLQGWGPQPRIDGRNCRQDLAGAAFSDRKMAESVRIAIPSALSPSFLAAHCHKSLKLAA